MVLAGNSFPESAKSVDAADGAFFLAAACALGAAEYVAGAGDRRGGDLLWRTGPCAGAGD